MTQTKFKTFICYRGTIDNGYGKRIAEQIYDLIKEDHHFSPVFYGPKMSNHDFMNVDEIIKNCSRFIIILSPNFFDGFLDEESATYKEMLAAFKSDCVFVPVYDYELFSMQGVIQTIKKIFSKDQGIDLNKLIHKSGVKLKTRDFEIENVNGLLTIDEVKNTSEPVISNRKLEVFLKNIGNTVLSKVVKQNQDEICSFRNTNSDRLNEYIMLLFKKQYYEVIKKCNLPSLDDFCTWAVELGEGDFELPINEPNDSISVCATCFGALLVDDWIRVDSELLGIKPNNETTVLANTIVNGAIELLLYLQDPVSGSWMASWDEATFVSGTINQTTLSLSTLFSCHFLDEAIEKYSKNKNKKNKEELESRFEIIKKGIDWLISAKKTHAYYYGDATSWGYMKDNKGSNILPTVFCFDVLVKYETVLDKLINDGCSNRLKFDINRERDRTSNILAEIVTYFRTEKDEIIKKKYVYASIISRSMALYLLNNSSNRHAMMLNDWCFTILYEQDFEELWELDKNIYYFEVFGPDENLKDNSNDLTDYIYITNNGEKYEICAEMILADALIKNALLNNRLGNVGIEKEAMEKAKNILTRFIKDKAVIKHSIVYIRGKRNDYPRYPIYLLYYFRKVVHDILYYNHTIVVNDEKK